MASGIRGTAPRASRGRSRRWGLLAAAALLAGCEGSATGSTAGGNLAPCPRIVILAEGADLTRFRPGAGRDLTALTAEARIAGFDAICDYASRDRSALTVRLVPRFEVERGPAAEGRTLDLPWFVALSDPGDANLLDRQSFTSRVSFAANVVRTNLFGQPARLTVPLAEGTRAADYTVRLSLQLTPEELALNRARGPR
ncbi:hypothetical protein [Falsiroseomonas selenitidurans]|uniref:Uncharacterized protein n=1 Tax=Falsiroseomonas selenitidurans TaxID=2716335 RepID=A0ABX1EAM4_9PROT|nr:hypothetical protein [Falsiroseomonas selenitidurans]NKC34239.1 hypothetical protein [Falsiroseomonas selenitidurans]